MICTSTKLGVGATPENNIWTTPADGVGNWKLMLITYTAYHQILSSFPHVPPEAGCILGAKDGIICKFHIDSGIPRYDAGIYTPNVHALNKTITTWSQEGIHFYGIAHSHPNGQTELSANDIAYIRTIMNSMPKFVNSLYFPLVFPGKKIVSFIGVRSSNEFNIMPDNITII